MKTLALNMIAGPDTQNVMRRCLESIDAKKNCDEIVIVVTTNQEEVMAEAKRWTDKALKFEWTSERFPHGDFGGARQMALENTKSDYILWLDTDDVVLPDSMRGFPELRKIISEEENADIKFFACPYRLNANTPDYPVKVLKRERVFKNEGVKWIYPIHEQLCFDTDGRRARIRNFIVDHHKEKTHESSVARNLAILKNEMAQEKPDLHIKLFYGQELLSASKADHDQKMREAALTILKDIVRKREGLKDNLAFVCVRIAEEYAYGAQTHIYISDDTNVNGKVSPKDIAIAETYARASKSFSDRYAEPEVILGDIYLYKKMVEKASDFFQAAMQKPLDSFDEQNVMYYEELPARRLTEIYRVAGRPEMSLHYSTILMKHCRDDKELYEFRRGILKLIAEKDEKDYAKYVDVKADVKDNTVAFNVE